MEIKKSNLFHQSLVNRGADVAESGEDKAEVAKTSYPSYQNADPVASTNIGSQQQGLSYKSKVTHSALLAWTLFSLGLAVGLNGPSFLDLQIITNTNVEEASAFFTGASIGYLVGSVLSGAIFEKVNKNLLLFAGTTGLGGFTMASPYCSNYISMIAIRTAAGIGCGILDTSGNAEHMRIWGSDSTGRVLMQLLHFTFALGGVISPLYCEPFLAKKENSAVQTYRRNLTTVDNVTSSPTSTPTTTNVHYAFLITGALCILSAIPWLVFFIQEKLNKTKGQMSTNETITQRNLPKCPKFCILLLLCCFYMLYSAVEDSFASYLMTFLVKEFDFVSKSQGAQITAVYWGSFAASRFLMIFLSKCLSSLQLLCMCCFLMAITYGGFLVSAYFASLPALITFCVLAGLSMSAVFPAGFSWTEEELIRVTACVSSCMLVSSSTGTMVNPLILGYLMERLTNMWFCYLLLMQTLALCLIFLFLLILSRCYLRRSFGPVVPTIEILS